MSILRGLSMPSSACLGEFTANKPSGIMPLPPSCACFSKRITLAPFWAAEMAAHKPAADHHDVDIDGDIGRGLGGYLPALGRRRGSLPSRLGQRLARIGLRALRGAPCQPESGKTAHGRRPCKKVPARDFHDSSFGLLPSLMQRSQDVSPCDRVVAGPMKPACVFGRNRFRGGKSPSAPYLPPPKGDPSPGNTSESAGPKRLIAFPRPTHMGYNAFNLFR